ncbi:hypothetical protein BC937DRAFT_89123 [Endogone sp. FLAS-F59071]|nr:hypothetical protein BC937DRAFT_89123 [Endogone sp. FLAS-F59071]|eukprot:RUS18129.1 hypothetical protein BC937DRAFT_89123 [Endogone sp. FLAS-F59071]
MPIHFPKKLITEDQLPLRIKTNVSVESYNKYFTNHSLYKLKRWNNRDIFMLEMLKFGSANPIPYNYNDLIQVCRAPDKSYN